MSDNIPQDVKRQLRQESGFGCCRCGSPILQYHHIIPRAVEDHNRPEDMMALCPGCHDMCTKGAADEAEQRGWKADPTNIRKGYVDGLLKVNQESCILDFGSCTVGGPGVVFSVNGEMLLELAVKDGRLAISVSLYGAKNTLLAQIVDNDWVAGNPAVWDIQADYQKLRIRTAKGDVRLELDARTTPMRMKAKLTRDGKWIIIRPTGLRTRGGNGGNLNMSNAAVFGATFDFDTVEDVLRLITGDSGAAMFLNPDIAERIDWLTHAESNMASQVVTTPSASGS